MPKAAAVPLVVASPWLKISEAALYLRVSPSTIRNLLHSGALKAARIGPTYRIDRTDLDQFLTKRKQIVRPYRQGTRPWVAARHERNRKASR